MDLPRFTSGAVGKLTFAHLNDAFETLDDLARDNGVGGSSGSVRGRAILARITGEQTGAFSWIELRRDGSAYVVSTGGRSSANSQSQYAYPAREFGGVVPIVGSDVVIFPKYDANGALYYVPIAGGSSVPNWPGMIMGSTPISAGIRWSYSVSECIVDSSTGEWSLLQGGRSGIAFNGCESIGDDPAPGLVGVGSCRGPALALVRNPIRNGVVVPISQDANARLLFSIPNGYCFTCV